MFSYIFPQRLGIFSPNFIRLLCVPIYTRLQIFIHFQTSFSQCGSVYSWLHRNQIHFLEADVKINGDY